MKNNNYEKLFNMSLEKLYNSYLNKVIRKGRTKEELDQVINWLTGYDNETLNYAMDNYSFKDFIVNAPNFNEKSSLITGIICGVRVEEIKDPLIQKIRYLDKLIDELANGRPLGKIFRE